MQSEPQRWSRLGACRGTSASDAGGERGAAAAGVRSAGPGGPHVRTAEAVAAVPGARGGVWGKPLAAAGNSAGAEPEPRGDGGTGRVRRRGGAAGARAGARSGRAWAAPREHRAGRGAQTLEPTWGRSPAGLLQNMTTRRGACTAARCSLSATLPRRGRGPALLPSAGVGDRHRKSNSGAGAGSSRSGLHPCL